MKRIFLFAFVLFFIPIMVFSASLSLNDALTAAKENNKDYALAVKQYRDTVNINNRANSFIPSLGLSANVGTGASFFNQNGADPTWSGLTYSVGLSSSLSLNGSSFFDKVTKDANNALATISLENKETELEKSVISSYLNLILSKENIRVAEQTLATSKETLNNSKESYENGLIPELSLLEAENQVSLNELNLDTLKNNYAISVLSFNNLTGLDFNSYDSFDDLNNIRYLNLPTGSELFENYSSSIPSLKNLRANINSTEVGYKSASTAAKAPIFTISGQYNFSGKYIDEVSMMNPKKSIYGDGLNVSVGISLPISSYFPSNSNKIQLDKLKNTVSDLNVQYANTVDTIKLALEQTVQGLKALEAQIKNTEKSLALMEKSYQATEDAYNNGQVSYSVLQTNFNSLTSMKYQILALKKSYLETSYTLSQTLGIDINLL